MKIIPDWYVLSLEELMILAAGSGISQFYGIQTESISHFTQEKYLKQIFAMVKKGLLQAEDDHVVVAKNCLDIFRNIRDAKHIILCYPGEEHMPQRCFYCADKAALLESSNVDCKKVRAKLIRQAEIWSAVMDQTYFPDGVPVSDAMFEGEVQEKVFDGWFQPVEQLMMRKETWMIIDSLNPLTGEVRARLRITKNPFGYGLIYQEEKEESGYFQKEKLSYYLKRMAGEIEYDNG